MSSDVRDEAIAGFPDVGHDKSVIASYEDAKLRYIRSITQDAETKLRDAFAKRREAINDEIANLRFLAIQRGRAADAATAAYATKLPNRVRKAGAKPPSLWERIRTFNAVDRFYQEAAKAAEELEEVNELLRKRRDRLDAMERETRRSIYLREEAVRKKLQTPEGLAALHGDPLVKAAFARMQGAMNERATYDDLVKRGDIPPKEARDREMAQHGWTFARVPLEGVMIARIVRYGVLEYYVLRDLHQREVLLACDPALEPLRDVVFELTQSSEGYEASLRHTPDGVPMRVLDHIKASFTGNDATEQYARHRVALRANRVTRKAPPEDDTEAEMVAMLVLLAQAVSARGGPPAGDGSPA